MSPDRWPELATSLRRLDSLLGLEIHRLRARYQLSLDEFRGLYITDEQVDALIGRGAGRDASEPHHAGPANEEILREEDRSSPLARVGDALGLNALERTLVLLALAPELDLKYETLYAYLNDDVSRKWPTVDLAERLLGREEPQTRAVRNALAPAGRLAVAGAIRRIDPPSARPSLLNAGFALAGPLVHSLVGIDGLSPELAVCTSRQAPAAAWDDIPVTPRQLAALRRIPELIAQRGELPIFVFDGDAAAGQDLAAEAIARDLGRATLVCDLAAARSAAPSLAPVGALLALEARLRPAIVMLTRLDTAGERDEADVGSVLRGLRAAGVPLFLLASGSSWQRLLAGLPTLTVSFDGVAFRQRAALWDRAAAQAGLSLAEDQSAQLADRFQLPPRKMDVATASARHLAVLDGRLEKDAAEYLPQAARSLVHHELGALGVKVTTGCGWDTLVLPPSTLTRLREFAAAIRSRNLVFEEWGFAAHTTSGSGVRALFAGQSGTGKTLTAAVIARELGFDLYRIDLSSVVSKYIGETEKNLERIFKAARGGHVMLFFDEADALFGKRSEVKDAHDRYANIEVAFLLQRMEDHDGVVILATNLQRNLDEAFARRLPYTIEFTPPDRALRERLWRGMFPARAPLADDIDFPFLAQQFELAGGDIRNVALDAAFLAAQDGHRIAMRQVVQALARQMIRQGKSPSPSAFRGYFGLVA
jgi:hypothetical protein